MSAETLPRKKIMTDLNTLPTNKLPSNLIFQLELMIELMMG